MGPKQQFLFPSGIIQGHFNPHKDQASPLLVFLHGFPDDSQVWSYQWEALKEHAFLWAPDLYNHPFVDQVALVTSFIEEHGKGRSVFIIAHDMGGPIAFEIARLKPRLMTKVLFINSLGLEQFLGRSRSYQQLFRSSYMLLFSGPLYHTSWWRGLAHKFLLLAYDKGGLPKEDSLRTNSNQVIEGIKRYRELLKEASERFKKTLNKIEVETCFLFGLSDPFLLVPTKQELNSYFIKWKLDTLSTGHWPQRELPSEVNQWILGVTQDE